MENKRKVSIGIYLIIKRIFDILISIIGCIFLIPISFFIKISYILSNDKEPIFFTQIRIGKNGKEFKFYKYRTMVVGADEILKNMIKENKSIAYEYKKNKKLKDDPRITKPGKFIRRYSIDELPQFINVLRGDMSLVGNRPYLVREKKDMGKHFDVIVKTKPGLTGIWQTSGRNDISFKRRLRLEEYYSKNFNILMDIEIFLKTFKVVFKGN